MTEDKPAHYLIETDLGQVILARGKEVTSRKACGLFLHGL